MHLARPDVAVDVGGDAYAGVPQYPADDLQLRPLPQHLRGVEVPQPVGSERLNAGPDAGPLQGLLDVVYLGVTGFGLPREEEGRVARPLLHVLPEGPGDFGQQGDDPKLVSFADNPDGGERPRLPRVGLRRQLRQEAGAGADTLRRTEEARANAERGRRGAGEGAPNLGKARLQRPGEWADARGVGDNNRGAAQADGARRARPARARLHNRAPPAQGSGVAGNGGRVQAAYRFQHSR